MAGAKTDFNQDDLNFHSAETLKGTFSETGERLYCTVPFRFIALSSEGIKPCTWLYQEAGYNMVNPVTNEKPLNDVWTGAEFTRVREQIKNGSYRSCTLKFCPQYQGERKFMLTMKQIETQFPDIYAFMQGQKFNGLPEEVNLGYETSCNLACPSCNISQLPVIPSEKKKSLVDEISLISSKTKEIFIAGMGDPFVSPSYRQFLKNFKSSDYECLERIVLQTNALLWNSKSWEALSTDVRQFVKIAVISIDGATKKTYEENRKNGRWETLLENLEFISSLRKNGPIRELKATYVYQDNNFDEMIDFLKLADKYFFDVVLFCRISNWGMSSEEFKHRDVANPSHPRHQKLLDVVKSVKNFPFNGKVYLTMG